MTMFGFDPPVPEVPERQLLRRDIECGYEGNDHRICDFTGQIIAIIPDDLNHWTCPKCEGLHEEDPIP